MSAGLTILLVSRESGGYRVDAFMGAYPNLVEANKAAVALENGIAVEWRELLRGTGPFESYSLQGIKPERVFRGEQSPENACYALLQMVAATGDTNPAIEHKKEQIEKLGARIKEMLDKRAELEGQLNELLARERA